MPKLTWPGYKYLGPGNKIEEGTPVNEADLIAKSHDIEYSQAKTKEDIYTSDKIAISEFRDSLVNNPSVGAAVGLIGLSIKHTVESGLNKTIYPFNLPTGQYLK